MAARAQGAFREILVCTEDQVVPVPDGLTLELAAFAEPLSVCLHAGTQAGPLLGRRVLVSGCGPIGALAILVAGHAGAQEVVATDLSDAPLAVARQIGADRTVNVRTEPGGLDRFASGKGYFDVVFEASGSCAALALALPVVCPGGVIVQVGLGGDITIPINVLVAKEIQLRGTCGPGVRIGRRPFQSYEDPTRAVNLRPQIVPSKSGIIPILTRSDARERRTCR
jgi:L-idonate 5-dehydrogenase